MFRVIYPNRYFFWAIALLVIFGIAMWGAVERFGIEQEFEFFHANTITAPRNKITIGDGHVGSPIAVWLPSGFAGDQGAISDSNDMFFSKAGQSGYGLRVALLKLGDKENFEYVILRDYYGFDNNNPRTFQGYIKSSVYPPTVKTISIVGLNGYYVNQETEAGSSDSIFLEDRLKKRVIIIEASPLGAKQFVDIKEFFEIAHSLRL
ncbi:MAG: hypothetical protein AAB795_01105 [Patescibacteria group bacterium]